MLVTTHQQVLVTAHRGKDQALGGRTLLGKLALGSPGGKAMVMDLSRDPFRFPRCQSEEGRFIPG